MSLFARCPDCHNGYKDGRPCLRCDYGYEELDRDAAIERMRQITSAWADSDYWASAISAEDASELLDAAAGTLDAAGGERT